MKRNQIKVPVPVEIGGSFEINSRGKYMPLPKGKTYPTEYPLDGVMRVTITVQMGKVLRGLGNTTRGTIDQRTTLGRVLRIKADASDGRSTAKPIPRAKPGSKKHVSLVKEAVRKKVA